MRLFSEIPVYIEKKKAGNSNPKCYLSDMKGCSDKISKEHYISQNLLDKIEKQNRTIDICGLSWLPKECLKSIGKANLASNILCTHHNSKLSGLDDEIVAVTSGGSTIRTDVRNISSQGRTATGVRVMTVEPGQAVTSVALILATDDDE